jgi:hypothetical protein
MQITIPDDKIIETIKSQANSLQKEKDRKGRQEVEKFVSKVTLTK